MVNPDQRINSYSNSNSSSIDKNDNKRRIPPNRKYDEVADRLKNHKEVQEDEDKLIKKPKIPTGQNKKSSALKSPFDLANGVAEEDADKSDLDSKGYQQKKDFPNGADLEPQALNPQAFAKLESDKQSSHFSFAKEEEDDLTIASSSKAQKSDLFTMSSQMNAGEINQGALNKQSPLEMFSGSTPLSTATTRYNSLQEMIDQIVKAVYTIEQKGQTDTVVSLRGAFEGSKLIVSEFNNAHGEMNITIDNLTGAQKNLLDANKSNLLQDLASKNIVVHIFNTTTAIEVTPYSEAHNNQGFKEQDPNAKQNRKNKRDSSDDAN